MIDPSAKLLPETKTWKDLYKILCKNNNFVSYNQASWKWSTDTEHLSAYLRVFDKVSIKRDYEDGQNPSARTVFPIHNIS
jgi:hypothetical protein